MFQTLNGTVVMPYITSFERLAHQEGVEEGRREGAVAKQKVSRVLWKTNLETADCRSFRLSRISLIWIA